MLSEKEFLSQAKRLYYLMIEPIDNEKEWRENLADSLSFMCNYDYTEYLRIINYLLDNYVIDNNNFIAFSDIYNSLNTNVSKITCAKLIRKAFYKVNIQTKIINNKQYKGFKLSKKQ